MPHTRGIRRPAELNEELDYTQSAGRQGKSAGRGGVPLSCGNSVRSECRRAKVCASRAGVFSVDLWIDRRSARIYAISGWESLR